MWRIALAGGSHFSPVGSFKTTMVSQRQKVRSVFNPVDHHILHGSFIIGHSQVPEIPRPRPARIADRSTPG
jgi:hypothetical protein